MVAVGSCPSLANLSLGLEQHVFSGPTGFLMELQCNLFRDLAALETQVLRQFSKEVEGVPAHGRGLELGDL